MTSTSGDIGAAFRAAQAYLDVENFRRAREVLESALAIAPDNPVLLAHHAQALVGMSDFIGAERSAYAALKVNPGDDHAQRLYVLALCGQGRIAEAEWMAWRAVSEHPDEYRTHLVYAQALTAGGHLQQALTVVTEAIRLSPESPDLFVLRGRILMRLGRTAESDADYREALRLQPAHASAVHNLAVNRMSRGRLLGALRGFVGAGGLDPAIGDIARHNIGLAVTRMLRWCSAGAVVLVWGMVHLGLRAEAGQGTVGWRVFVGVVAAGLVVTVGRLARTVPPRMVGRVLRERPVLGLRLLVIALAVLLGVVGVVFGGPAKVLVALGPLLLLISVVLLLVGRYTGQ